ncbi:hypothetical protein Tco_0588005 [Tanacetum coccineum]
MQERFNLNNTQGASTPDEVKRMQIVPYASAVGSIIYATIMKTILKYLRNTKDMFLVYGGNPEAELRVDCNCNAGFETDRDDIKSQTGCVFILNGGAVEWKSFKQITTVMSATEAEYIASSEATMEAVWIKKFISGLVIPTPVFLDSHKDSTQADGAQRHQSARATFLRIPMEPLGSLDLMDDSESEPFEESIDTETLNLLVEAYACTSELVEDSEEEDDEEDEEIVESMDSDSVSEDVEDDGPTAEDEDLAAEDEDPAVEDEGLTTGVEGPSMDNEGYGLVDESRGIDDEGHR